MKKILLFLILSFISIFGMAQTDVTKFLGIPVDGSKSEMIRKLNAKGFKQSPVDKDVLTGKFNGMDVNVHIATNNDKVCRIMVCDVNTMNETDIRIRFNVLCEQFKNNSKYRSFSEEDPKIKENEDILHEMLINKKRYEADFYQIPDTTVANNAEATKKLVWFMISSDHYGEYYITIFYDNEYNRAQGEDL